MLNRKSRNHFTRILILTVIAGAGTQAQAAYTVQPYKAGNITYVTGGIGDEERQAIQAVKSEYNLSIVSAAKSGHYAGDTQVAIFDRNGQKLLNTQAGPLFYAQLPDGNYTVEAKSEGQSRKQDITVAEGKPTHLHFSW